MGEGQPEEDVTAVDVAVSSRLVVQRLTAQEFVQGQVGAAVVVKAGGGAKSRGVSKELAYGRLRAGHLAGHCRQEVADGLVQVEQAVTEGLPDQGPRRHSFRQ